MLVQPGYSSFCDINQTVSCQQAYLSRYGSVWGVPVALYGVIWFAFVLVLAFVGAAGPESVRESMPAYLFATATVGLAVMLYMAYAAFFVLKAVCVLCLTTYAAVIGLFIVSGLSKSMPPMTTLPRRVFGDLRALVARPALLSVVIVFLAGAVSAVAFFPDEAALRTRAAAAARGAAGDGRPAERVRAVLGRAAADDRPGPVATAPRWSSSSSPTCSARSAASSFFDDAADPVEVPGAVSRAR